MEYLLALAASYAPALIWLAFFYHQDRYHRQPKRLVGVMFLLGLGAIAPTIMVNAFVEAITLGPVSLKSAPVLTATVIFAVLALTEESAKALFGFVGFGRSDIEEPIDGLVLMTTLALGFAAAETTIYVVDDYHDIVRAGAGDIAAVAGALLVTAPSRALITALGHASWSGIVGYARGGGLSRVPRPLAVGGALVLAAALHAAFNVSAYGGLQTLDVPKWIWVIPWAIAIGLYAVAFNRGVRRSPFRLRQWKARLVGLPMFADLPPERLRQAAAHLKGQSVEPGEIVLHPSEMADHFWIVAAGQFTLASTAGDDQGGSPTVKKLGPGDAFGQLGLLAERTGDAVTAETEGLLLSLDGKLFHELVGSDPIVIGRLLHDVRGQVAANVVAASLHRLRPGGTLSQI